MFNNQCFDLVFCSCGRRKWRRWPRTRSCRGSELFAVMMEGDGNGFSLMLPRTDDVLPSLEDQGVRQLYPKGLNVDFKKELRSLNRELQLHILELADVLVERPSQYARRVEDISLLNSLRPHQARATLIHILELQIQWRREAVEDIKRKLEDSEAAEQYCAEMGRPALQVIEALKNNDVGRFREMLLEQQTSEMLLEQQTS
ncbi:hypothetical protein MKW98_001604 [Papaver atlanticum]|uniref:Mediator of RNA polymerase II transcription subunit 7 n=1 Tax=Papaver atlanticum TaxID=357466 RepID=A0AAD4S878_9MAGN|nr:hypothetical protein MKW98_001604 [Papaver atlanticum]